MHNDADLLIPPHGALDLVALGALVIRLDPGVVPFRTARSCDIHVSGGEFNVAANLADCFGLRTGIVTSIVDYPIGDLAARRVRESGVTPFFTRFEHDGVRGPNIATVFSDRGHGARPPVVFYNRADEAAARLGPGDVDWDAVFAGGVRWFHSGGIFASLSERTAELIIEGMQVARSSGTLVSFDLNFREKLWRASGGMDRAQAVMGRIVENVDVLIGNEEDLQRGLGITGPDVASTPRIDTSAYDVMMDRVVERYPGVKLLATTLRQVHSANRHSWAAVVRSGAETFRSPTCELDVLDRVGGGDGFAAGLFYGLLTGASMADAVRLGWAHGALVTTYPGDTTMASLEQVRSLATGASARIIR